MTSPNSELRAATRAMVERSGVDTATPATGQDTAVWAALAEAGFTEIGIPESAGGSGGSLAEALTVVSAAVTGGALTMLIEHTVLATWLAARCGISLGAHTATIATAGPDTAVHETGDGRLLLDGSVRSAVHGPDADRLVVLLDPAADRPRAIAILSPTGPGVTSTTGADLLGASVADYDFAAAPVESYAESTVGGSELRFRGALAYAVAMAAAARAVCDRTIDYAGQRTQFGRRLSKFQAVQQRLAGLAALTALTETAARSAVAENDAGENSDRARIAIAAAKVVTSASAREIAAAGHQLHGAIGFTSEYPLGRSTTALWTWRERYGSERYWAGDLADRILEDGADVWDLVAGSGPADTGAAAEGNSR
ncbi:acyl-CoA dehydrogenase family protein [Nocardia sp. NPDC003963]